MAYTYMVYENEWMWNELSKKKPVNVEIDDRL